MRFNMVLALMASTLMLAQPALAQQVMGASVRAAPPTYINGETRPLSLTVDGRLRTESLSSGGSPNSAQGATTTGQSNTLVGCAVTTSQPSYVSGTTDPLSCDTSGNQRTTAILAPSTLAAHAVAPVVTTAVNSALVIKASAGNLYDWQVTTGASAGYVLIFNAITAPADGAVTPTQCSAVAANTTVGASMTAMPERFSTGITIVFSTTGCFAKAASATAFIRGRAQ